MSGRGIASSIGRSAIGLIFALQVGPVFAAAGDTEPPAIVPPAAAAPPEDGQWTMPAKNYASTRYSEPRPDQRRQRQEPAGRVHLLDRRERGPGSGAARRRRHDVHRDALSEHPLRARSHEAGRADEVEIRAQARAGARRAWPAATSSIAAPPMPTAGSSSTRSTTTPSRSTPRRGQEVWRTKLGNINIGETMTMAPLVVKDKVLVGNSGGEFGVRGWLTALDASDRQASSGAPTAPGPTRTC